MTSFHAVMLDETRCEFGVSFTAANRDTAYEYLRENYPESQCVQLEAPEDTAEREHRMYDLIRRGADFDEDGRPFFPNGDEDDYDDEEDDYE